MSEKTTDFGFETVKVTEKQKLVAQVFDSVAGRYDLMNDLMSMGLHRLWKRHAISVCQIRADHQVLDLASGTGDLALLIAAKVPQGNVTLCDINFNMLIQAQTRLIDKGMIENTDVVQANAQYLPFADNSFDRIIIGFGLRNVTDKEQALRSMHRVLRPGGRMIILEFSHPVNATLSSIYDTYSFNILPKLGEWVAKDSDSYRYLAESIRMHPDQEALKDLVLKAGFDSCDYQNLMGGIVAIHKGLKY
jgi:demethylmenaquinone methyltransferase/2-methoxy-6-polyprenyl-1,4-benzoquinol methylase